jgi:hypothetical protein
VRCVPDHIKHTLKNHYNFSSREQEQIIAEMFSSRRTPSKIEEIGQLIEGEKLIENQRISKEQIVNMVKVVDYH